MRITPKAMFSRLWNEGVFGNRPVSWPSLDEAIKSDFPGKVALRYNGHGAGGPFVQNLKIIDLPQVIRELGSNGWSGRDLYAYEDTPTDGICINGEVREYGGEFCLLYSTVPKRMRESLKEGRRWATGIVARNVLRTLLAPDDREHLFGLLDKYSEHAIEFTGYHVRVGILQSRMIVWEVRCY